MVGGEIIGGDESTLMRPATVYGVTKAMRLWTEEQFGPIVAVSFYDPGDGKKKEEEFEEIVAFARDGGVRAADQSVRVRL